jgi:hypothetical protein
MPAEGGVARRLTFYPAQEPLPQRRRFDKQVYGYERGIGEFERFARQCGAVRRHQTRRPEEALLRQLAEEQQAMIHLAPTLFNVPQSNAGGIMKKLSIREMRSALTQVDRLLEQHGEIILTRRRRPVARLLKIGGVRGLPSHKSLRDSMPMMKVPSEVLVREDRDAR